MAEITTDNMGELWNYLGSVWGNLSLEDKAFIEHIWGAYADVVSPLGDDLVVIKNNRSVGSIGSVVTELDNSYDIIYATTDEDLYGSLVNTYSTTSGLVGYQLGDMIIDVSGLVNYHYVDEANPWVAEELMEGVDFVVSGYNSLVFLNDPPFTVSLDYPTLSRSTLHIGKLEKINMMLFRVWGEQLGFYSKNYVNESYDCWSKKNTIIAYKQDRANHYREIIRALKYWSLQVPTLDVIKHSVGIANGLPFAYESGILTHNTVLSSYLLDEELIINGGFTKWYTGDPGGWSVVGEALPNAEVSETAPASTHGGTGTGACNMYTLLSGPLSIGQSILTIGKTYRIGFGITARTGGSIQITLGDGSVIASNLKIVDDYEYDFTATHTEVLISIFGSSLDLTIDNVSVKEYGPQYHADVGAQELWLSTSGEMSYLVEGSHDRFELLVDSYNIYDYISNSGIVEQYMDSDTQADKRNILVAATESGLVNDFPYSNDIETYNEWILRTIPKQLKFFEVTSE